MKKHPKITGIYKIQNLLNGKCYIGQSIDIYSRWYEHTKASKFNNLKTHLYRSMRKYGVNYFLFEIIEECDVDQLLSKEEYYIKLFNSCDNGYNDTYGGNGCFGTPKKETIEKRVKSIRGSRWMNKNGIQKRIKSIDDQNKLLSEGWKYGQLPLTEDRKIRQKMANEHPTKGYKNMFKGEKESKVPPEKVQEYLNDGWNFGRPEKMKVMLKNNVIARWAKTKYIYEYNKIT